MSQNSFDDLDYAYDGTLLPSQATCRGSVRRRGTWASTYHEQRLRSKTLVIVRHCEPLPSALCRCKYRTVSEFIYLGNKISSDRYSIPEVMRCIALAALAMNQLGPVWRQRNPSPAIKLRLYETCILSVLLYCSESWTLL